MSSVVDAIAAGARSESKVWAAALRDAPEWEPVFSPLAPEDFALGLETVYEAYLVHYGWYERGVDPRAVGQGSPLVDRVTGWSDDIADWIYRVGPTELGLVLALALASVLVATLGTRARRH